MPKCRACGKEAWIRVPWANAWFCKEHYIRYYEEAVWRTFKKYVPRSHSKMLFAVSGGKDSIALLHALASRLVEQGKEVAVLYIDLGIKDYTDEALSVVEENTKNLGLRLIVKRLLDYDFTIDDVATLYYAKILKRPICSVCGLAKRYLMNLTAVEEGYDLVLTGHNLDDAVVFSLISIGSGRLSDLVKMKPYTPGKDKLVARAKPLIFMYEIENQWYVEAKGLRILSGKCPYTPVKESMHFDLKEALRYIDEKHPGYMKMLMKNIVDSLIPSIKPRQEEKLIQCSTCGMPSSTDPCGFCRIRNKINKIVSGLKFKN